MALPEDLVDLREDRATNPLRERGRKKKRRMILEPCTARAADVAHNPPLDRQASVNDLHGQAGSLPS